MSDMTDPDGIEPITRTCQIIVGALIMGVLTFLAIVVFLNVGAGNPAPGPGRAGHRGRGAALAGGRVAAPDHGPGGGPGHRRAGHVVHGASHVRRRPRGG